MKHERHLQGVGSAIRNNYNDRVTIHPYSKPWNKTCLMCDVPVYHDGQIYWSLCLNHLELTELGPFRRRMEATFYD